MTSASSARPWSEKLKGAGKKKEKKKKKSKHMDFLIETKKQDREIKTLPQQQVN